ncbi:MULTISPECIES: YtxH domain-containing protein [unclassified Sporolactobacillus]|uniref:YtxH domain-containing protein n=1 Tax=unclassified Sporolactobacillus TaxID=2628533 RepID=UPI002367B506|nr:YtxH domain-containing protein [Sporolactobacillus sp. CQH2019]MDD9149434.1 YtxH domain-containing protein [Sporolactobacillus sp. CQH2019]
MGKFISYTIGAAIGGLVGGTVVLLVTPKKGEDVRNDIWQKASSIQQPLKDAASNLNTVKDRVLSLKDESLPVLKSTMSDIGDLLKGWKEDVQPYLTKIKNNVVQLEAAKEKLSNKLKSNAPEKKPGEEETPPSL